MFEFEIEMAIDAAKKAGNYLREQPIVEVKSQIGKDVKLNVDRESEKIITDTLSRSNLSILTEESGWLKNDSKKRWIVDPLDGSANYWRGKRELCCVSIALWDGSNPLFGVIYRFQTDDLFIGGVNNPATLNGKLLHTSTNKHLSESFIATGLPVNYDYSSESVMRFMRMIHDFKKVRMFGSAALMGASVAEGYSDVYYEENIMIWDIAAAVPLVESAGGCSDLEFRNDNKCICRLYANEMIKKEFNNIIN